MKSITTLSDQNQPQKANGNEQGAGEKGNEKKISLRTAKDEQKKSAIQFNCRRE